MLRTLIVLLLTTLQMYKSFATKDIMETNNVKKMLINHYGEASTRLKSTCG